MSEREFAFGQLLTTLEPLSELEVEFAQCVFNARLGRKGTIMIYASKTPRDLNHDPTPWHCPGADEKYRIPEGDQLQCDEYRPRPEYDHPQHNKPNPLLVAARDEGADYWIENILTHGDSLSGGWVGDMKVLPAHVAHARLVLTRLVG